VKFAKTVFSIAGVFGVVALTPLYFLIGLAGRLMPPAVNHPELYYGFIGVALVWQCAYLAIGSDPGRFRPMMILAALAKFSFVGTLGVLYLQDRLGAAELAASGPDALFCVLFVVAFFKTAAAF